MSVHMTSASKADLYLGRRIGSVEVIKTTDRMITFLCNCGETFDRARASAEFKPPMSCKLCHKAHISSVSSSSCGVPYNKKHENMTRDNTPGEDAMIKAFMSKQKKAS